MKKLSLPFLLFLCFALTSYSQQSINTNQSKHKPKASYQVGNAKITMWENNGKNGSWQSYQVEKVYKKDNKWLTSNSFNTKELLELKEAIEKAIAEEDVKLKPTEEEK